MSDTNITLEILVNLIYLAKHSAGEPQKVIGYLDEAERLAMQLAKDLHNDREI